MILPFDEKSGQRNGGKKDRKTNKLKAKTYTCFYRCDSYRYYVARFINNLNAAHRDKAESIDKTCAKTEEPHDCNWQLRKFFSVHREISFTERNSEGPSI